MLDALQDGLVQPLLPALHCIAHHLPTAATAATTAPATAPTTTKTPVTTPGVGVGVGGGTPHPPVSQGGVVLPLGMQQAGGVGGVLTGGGAHVVGGLLFGDFSSSSDEEEEGSDEEEGARVAEEDAQHGRATQENSRQENQGEMSIATTTPHPPSTHTLGTSPTPREGPIEGRGLVPYMDFASPMQPGGHGVRDGIDHALTEHVVNDALTWDVEEEAGEDGQGGRVTGEGARVRNEDEEEEEDALLDALIAEDALLQGVDGNNDTDNNNDDSNDDDNNNEEEEEDNGASVEYGVHELVQGCFDAALHAGMCVCRWRMHYV